MIRGYLVFFDTGSAALTERARQIIRELSEARRRAEVGLIVVRAHVDGAEAPRYPGLDERRAAVVRREMLADGIPAGLIALTAEGASRMLIPSDKPDPQNRYVTFILSDLFQHRSTAGPLACAAWVHEACFPPHATGSPAACDRALQFLARES